MSRARGWRTDTRAKRRGGPSGPHTCCEAQEVLLLARGGVAHRADGAPASVVGYAAPVPAGDCAAADGGGGLHRAPLHAARRARTAGARRPAPPRIFDSSAAAAVIHAARGV